MLLPIYTYGQPVLRKQAEDITSDYPGLGQLIDDMFETLGKADGVGLAAPQIGKSIRLVVIDLDVIKDDNPEFAGFRHAYINPHIIETDGEMVSMDEGCLSIPGIHESVKRNNRVHVTYLDENFQPHDEWVEGFLARVMQHEFDHLDGVMYVDHLSGLRKQMIKSKLKAIITGKVKCTYRIKPVKR